MREGSAGGFWSDDRYRIAVGVAGGVLALFLFGSGFRHRLQVLPRPPKPEVTASSAAAFVDSVDRTPAAYKRYVEADAEQYGVPVPSLQTLSGPFQRQVDDKTHTLTPGKDDASSVVAAGLRLRVATRDTRHTTQTMVLMIENMTDTPLAYRVDTVPSRGTQPCTLKEAVPYNAIAIRPGEMLMRSECIYRDGWKLRIEHVETIALPPLSYFYVSRLFPAHLGIDRRVVDGHKPPEGKTCQLVLPASVTQTIEDDPGVWRNLIDFYARHRCETYAFPDSYKAVEEGGRTRLPATRGRR